MIKQKIKKKSAFHGTSVSLDCYFTFFSVFFGENAQLEQTKIMTMKKPVIFRIVDKRVFGEDKTVIF